MDYFQVGHWALTAVTTGASTCEFDPSTSLRDHLRIATSSEDALLLEKFVVARKKIEGRTLRPCFKGQFDLAVDRFPCDGSPIRMPRLPLVSVDSVWSYDLDGTSSQFGSSGYFVDTYSEPGRLCLKSGYAWPTGRRDQVGGVIRFTAGYSTTPASGIPDPLVEAIRKLATELYENREAVVVGQIATELPLAYEEMLSDYLLPEVG